jgi:hypothetical protein
MNTIRKCMTIKTEERNLPSGSYKKPEVNFVRKDGRTRGIGWSIEEDAQEHRKGFLGRG